MLACSLQSLLWTPKKAQHRQKASCAFNSQSVGHIQQLDKPAVGQLRMKLYSTICLTGQWCYISRARLPHSKFNNTQGVLTSSTLLTSRLLGWRPLGYEGIASSATATRCIIEVQYRHDNA